MEIVTDRPGRRLAILHDDENLVVTEGRYGPGERGAEPHVHREHADAFYVLAGALALRIGEERLSADAGTLALFPPGVVHGFDNDSEAEVHFLNFHAPNGDFAAYLRDGTPFDTHPPPPDGGLPASDALVSLPGEGERLALGPSSVVLRAQGRDWLSLSESTLAPGFPGPVRHVHRTFTDSFYVLEGTLTVQLDGTEREIGPGGFAAASPGMPHTFANRTEAPVRLLNAMAPGGFEQYLKEVAASSAPPSAAEMAAIASRHDFTPAA